MYPAVIVKALYGNGVKPARKIIKNPCSLNNFLAYKKFFSFIMLLRMSNSNR